MIFAANPRRMNKRRFFFPSAVLFLLIVSATSCYTAPKTERTAGRAYPGFGYAEEHTGAGPLLRETITMATWNIRNFSSSSRDDGELKLICSILQRYDFLALQEVLDTDVLDRAVDILQEEYNKPYEYIVSPKLGRSRKEIYGFFYNSDKVFWDDDTYLYPDTGDYFEREPFAADFIAGEFDFLAVSFHAVWGDSVGKRRAEALLLDDVHDYLAETHLIPHNEGDIIFMGDFNLPFDDEGFREFDAVPGIVPLNRLHSTTIADKQYDNIWVDREETNEYTGKQGVYLFDIELFGDDDRAANLAVSDHRPFWAVIDISGPDDD